ncbi:MAG TPA: lipopolysaccharide kinase InaA family protein [Longimicrobium sp.]|jgi:3-deoxy-D-manno-octulosonic acid kinase
MMDFYSVSLGSALLHLRQGYEGLAGVLVGAWFGLGKEWIEGGRAPHPVIALPDGGKAVVRRYRRGGMVRHLNRDRYFGGDRALDELRATEAARAGGVRAPEVIAAGKVDAFPGYRAMIATRLIPGVQDAATALHAGRDKAEVLWEAGQQIARMHAAGVAHPDLNLRNLLVGKIWELWVIDFDRARVMEGVVPRARRERDLARLARSAAKLGLPLNNVYLGWLRAGYVSERPDFE